MRMELIITDAGRLQNPLGTPPNIQWEVIQLDNNEFNEKRVILKENNKLDDDNIISEENMSKTRKRIYNPITKKYYQLRQKTTSRGKRGEIKGLWKPPAKDAGKKSILDLFK